MIGPTEWRGRLLYYDLSHHGWMLLVVCTILKSFVKLKKNILFFQVFIFPALLAIPLVIAQPFFVNWIGRYVG